MDVLSLFSGCALQVSAQCPLSATPAHAAAGVAQWHPMVPKLPPILPYQTPD